MSEHAEKQPRTMIALVIWACVIAVFLVGLKTLFNNRDGEDLTGNAAGGVGQNAESDPGEGPDRPAGETQELPKEQLAKDIKEGKVAALINGEPVYFKELDRGLPAGTYGPRLTKGRQMRLEMVARFIKVRQFLKKKMITVPKDKITEILEEYKKNPPAMSCGCCRYSNINDFLELNFMTLDDLRAMAEVEEGFETYLKQEWERELKTGDTPAEYCKTHWPDVTEEYVKAYHIFFNVWQDPEYRLNPDKVKEKKLKEAEKAWKRLENGEEFEALVSEVSDDEISLSEGGLLGYVLEGFLSKEFTDKLFSLSENTYSKPVSTVYGFHIIKRGFMGENDKIIVLENEFRTRIADETMAEIERTIEMKTYLGNKKDEDIDFME